MTDIHTYVIKQNTLVRVLNSGNKCVVIPNAGTFIIKKLPSSGDEHEPLGASEFTVDRAVRVYKYPSVIKKCLVCRYIRVRAI